MDPVRDRMVRMRFPPRKLLILGGLLLAATLMGGCEKALFIEHESRTPYDRYMALRGKQSAMSEANVYGGSVPALRERLKPLGAP